MTIDAVSLTQQFVRTDGLSGAEDWMAALAYKNLTLNLAGSGL